VTGHFIISVVLICTFAVNVPAGQSKTTSKTDKRAEEVKSKVRSLGIASRITVKLKNENERYGAIERIDEDSFQLAEVDLKQIYTVSYSDVRKIREGYGNPNQFTGKRWNPIWAKIALAASLATIGVLTGLAIAAASD
jgi:hypothetical protein